MEQRPLSPASRQGDGRLSPKPALHVAIIMDGNGRWATARGWPRRAGHRTGAHAVRRVVEEAARLGFGTLTLFAFSSDNWQRPGPEVSGLMRLFEIYLRDAASNCARHGIRVSVIGRRDRLSTSLKAAVESAEAATAGGDKMHLRIAVDYSAREMIFRAALRLRHNGHATREDFACLVSGVGSDGRPVADVDLLIRTGGEQRLSDFLLWESSYAELFFTDRMWPDFGAADLEAAVNQFQSRQRRFGRIVDARPVDQDFAPAPNASLSCHTFTRANVIGAAKEKATRRLGNRGNCG
ncbi:MAG TPA: di-trans,poly-cis-decaprenylcistransferase [Terriglobia bacterium]|nr:di-trans,poly-cis-decaprenylcistransferase [Terriglobia bacterium]